MQPLTAASVAASAPHPPPNSPRVGFTRGWLLAHRSLPQSALRLPGRERRGGAAAGALQGGREEEREGGGSQPGRPQPRSCKSRREGVTDKRGGAQTCHPPPRMPDAFPVHPPPILEMGTLRPRSQGFANTPFCCTYSHTNTRGAVTSTLVWPRWRDTENFRAEGSLSLDSSTPKSLNYRGWFDVSKGREQLRLLWSLICEIRIMPLGQEAILRDERTQLKTGRPGSNPKSLGVSFPTVQ
jgi:hypothetical protein